MFCLLAVPDQGGGEAWSRLAGLVRHEVYVHGVMGKSHGRCDASRLQRRTVMYFTLDPQVAEALARVAAAMAANSLPPSSTFFGGRRLL